MDFALQYLKHGKALCGAVFGSFVETFNRLVDFYANLKGDAETGDDGCITVDRADQAHPIIRFDKSKLPATSGGGGGAEYIAGDDTNIVFTPETGDDGSETGRVKVDVYYI